MARAPGQNRGIPGTVPRLGHKHPQQLAVQLELQLRAEHGLDGRRFPPPSLPPPVLEVAAAGHQGQGGRVHELRGYRDEFFGEPRHEATAGQGHLQVDVQVSRLSAELKRR